MKLDALKAELMSSLDTISNLVENHLDGEQHDNLMEQVSKFETFITGISHSDLIRSEQEVEQSIIKSKLKAMSSELKVFCEENNLELSSADEIETDNPFIQAYLDEFGKRWNELTNHPNCPIEF